MSFGKSVFTFFALLMFSGMAATTANAAVIFNQTYDANDLLGFVTPNRTGSSVTGDTLVIGTTTTGLTFDEGLEIDIFNPGALSESNTYTITLNIEQNIAAGTIDQDPVFGFGAGSRFMGVAYFNAPTLSQVHVQLDTAPTISNSGGVDRLVGLGVHATTVPFNNATNAVFTAGAIDTVELFAPTSLGSVASPLFDVSQGLTFRMFGNNVNEKYGIKSVSITVETDAVPGPGALALLGFGLLGLGMRRRAA